MKTETLLERIVNGGPRRVEDHEAAMIASIVDHLRKMLNTRQGHAGIALDYGMPDFTDLVQLPDVGGMVQTAILDSIRKYEPRLRNVRVKYINIEGLEIRFEIVGALQSDKRPASIRLQTLLEPSGKVRIDG